MKRSDLIATNKLIDSIVDEYGLVLPDGYKRRDPSEPARPVKEMWEGRLNKIFRKRFRNQLRMIEDYLEKNPLKSASSGNAIPIDDPETNELLLDAFIGMMEDGFQEAAVTHTLELSFAQYNSEVLPWVDQWVYELADLVDATTGSRLERELTSFVTDEAYTIQDVVRGLESSGLDTLRAEKIAVNEVTRAFGKAEYVAGQMAAAEYPDVKVVKTWYTNNDALVCRICSPLNGMVRLMDEEFIKQVDHPPAHMGCRCWMQTRTDILNEIERTPKPEDAQVPIPGFENA